MAPKTAITARASLRPCRSKRFSLGVSLAALLWPALALSASVHALFDLSAPARSPFPSDRYTVEDPTQNTGLRMALPKPDCSMRPSDCADLDVLNELDGFNLEPRLSIPFDGPIDPATATSASIFLVSLGSTLPGGEPGGRVSGIDRVVWDPPSSTLHVESDEVLDQHTRYVLVVTKGLHDPEGKEIKAAKEFVIFTDETNTASTGDPALDAYRSLLQSALVELDSKGIVSKGQVLAASVFTTLSATANLEKMRDQIKTATPAAADFMLGPGGSRSVFAFSTVARIVANRQTSANPAAPLSNQSLPLAVLNVVPGSIGSIALGKYVAPDYRVHPGEFIPQVGTRSGTPLVQGASEITFILYLPSTPKPAAGYPVAIWGHGSGSDKGSSGFVAPKLAEHGIATIAINAPGYGFGPLSALTLTFTDLTSVTVRSGGRGFDQDGDGTIGDSEGFGPVRSKAVLGHGRGDGHRQWAADHMQLVREVEVGMDVDGDGASDLDPSRIYFAGPSGGAGQGAVLLAVEPSIRAGVLNVPGGSTSSILWSAGRRSLGSVLQARAPSLINPLGIMSVDGISVDAPHFNENLPLPDQAPVRVGLLDGSQRVVRSPQINTIPGAMAIQEVLERAEWAFGAASSVVYASHLRRHPLAGVPAKSMIVQLAFGDRNVPNPSTTALLRAGDLADRATFFRSDLAFPDGNPTPFPGDPNLYPHAFLQVLPNNPALISRALQAEAQIASFFALDGPSHILDPFDASQVVDPDLDEPVFETPIQLPLPTGLNYPGSAVTAVHVRLAPVSVPREDAWPSHFALAAPRPNPSRGQITLDFIVPQTAHVSLAIYDVTGRMVRELMNGPLAAGRHSAFWDSRDRDRRAVPSGVYLVRLAAPGAQVVRKAVIREAGLHE